MSKKSVYVWIGQDRRDVLIELSLTGYTTLSEARDGIIKHLLAEGVEGEHGGTIVSVEPKEGWIAVETTTCGFCIDDNDTTEALSGRRVKR